MKKVILSLLLFLVIFIVFGCKDINNSKKIVAMEESIKIENRIFVDSLGREFNLPSNITKIAASGLLSQIVLFSLSQDKFVGLTSNLSEYEKEYYGDSFANLPVLGQLYGGKGDLNFESLIASGAEVVIDIGEPKLGISDDLDRLTEQTGIPFIHLTFTLDTIEDCFKKLGELLNEEKKANEVIKYCNDTINYAKEFVSHTNKKNVAYCIGKKGLNVIAEKSYFSEVINLVANNVIKIDEPSNKGSGNEIDIEQLLIFNPDYIIFEDEFMYDNVNSLKEWSDINAIKNNNYYLVPSKPYNILGFPPSIQKILGIKWLISVLYKDEIDFDIYKEFANFYELFYNIKLNDSELERVLNIK